MKAVFEIDQKVNKQDVQRQADSFSVLSLSQQVRAAMILERMKSTLELVPMEGVK